MKSDRSFSAASSTVCNETVGTHQAKPKTWINSYHLSTKLTFGQSTFTLKSWHSKWRNTHLWSGGSSSTQDHTYKPSSQVTPIVSVHTASQPWSYHQESPRLHEYFSSYIPIGQLPQNFWKGKNTWRSSWQMMILACSGIIRGLKIGKNWQNTFFIQNLQPLEPLAIAYIQRKQPSILLQFSFNFFLSTNSVYKWYIKQCIYLRVIVTVHLFEGNSCNWHLWVIIVWCQPTL